MKAFHCLDPKERQIHLVPMMLFPEPPSSKYHEEIWLHGSLMLQYIFGYEETYKISKSLLSLEPRELSQVCNDKSGSHVIDSFLQSTNVSSKHKSAFVDKMRGSFIDLACDRFGSRIIDYLLSTLDIKAKGYIMDELSAKEMQLNANKNGYFIGKKAGLYHYKHRYEEWREIEKNREKKRRAFKVLLEDGDGDDRNDEDGYPKTKRTFFKRR